MIKYSFKCITHGRVHLLEEALQSFLSLYNKEDAELVIVNDYSKQKLIFEHPQVKIYNLDTIFPTIGEKENFAIERCSGDVIVVFDDDDIALPNHLDNIKKYFLEGTDLLFWGNAVYYNEPNISALTGVGNSGIVYSKSAWEKIGKSPIMNAGGDMVLVDKIKEIGNIGYAYPPNSEISWFYRWSLPMNYHQSGMGTDTPDRENIVIRNHMYVESLRLKKLIPEGNIQLKPHWNYDYEGMLKNYIKK